MIEIIHISDLHFGKTKAWTRKVQRLLERIRKRFPFGENRVMRLLITGDTIHNSNVGKSPWRGQYRMAVAALRPFLPNIAIVPGNHDYGFGGVTFSKKMAAYFDDAFLPALQVRCRFGRKHPSTEVLDDGQGSRVALIGLNSCVTKLKPQNISKGCIEGRQLATLRKILENPRHKGIPKIVLLHHIPHRRAQGLGMSLTDHAKLMSILENQVAAVAFGHEGAMEDPKRKRARSDAHDNRPMRVRRTGFRGIKYYLDANACVKEQSCYDIKIEGTAVTARRIRL